MQTIKEWLLDDSNSRRIRGRTIGERVRALGLSHLWNGRGDTVVDTVVVHYISAAERTPARPYAVGSILEILCDLGVSSHYLILRRGTVIRLVPESERAWHAGGSVMPPPDNRRDVNTFSVGIELVATHTSGFTTSQYAALAELCRRVAARAKRPIRILGHEHVAGGRAVELGLRAERKHDPGPEFSWRRLLRRLGNDARECPPGLLLTPAEA